MKLLAVIAAIMLASFTKPKPRDWVLLQCYQTPIERNQGLSQALTSMIFSGMEVVGYETRTSDSGSYCFEIHFADVIVP